MKLTRAEAETFKARIKVECNGWDYIAWVDGMEEEFATTWGSTPEVARADMEERLDEAADTGLVSYCLGESFMEDPN